MKLTDRADPDRVRKATRKLYRGLEAGGPFRPERGQTGSAFFNLKDRGRVQRGRHQGRPLKGQGFAKAEVKIGAVIRQSSIGGAGKEEQD